MVLEFDGDLKYVRFKEKCENIACAYALHIKHLEAVQTKRVGADFLWDRLDKESCT